MIGTHQHPSGTHGVRLRDGVDLPCCYFWLVAPRRCSHLGGIICVNGDDLCTQGFLLLLLSERELLSAQFLLLGVLLLLRHLLQEWCCLVAYSHTVRLHSRIWDVRMKAEMRPWSQAKILTDSCKAHVPQNVTQWAAVAHLL